MRNHSYQIATNINHLDILVSVVAKSKKIKARLLSLDGLLDYRPSDKMEKYVAVTHFKCSNSPLFLISQDFRGIDVCGDV